MTVVRHGRQHFQGDSAEEEGQRKSRAGRKKELTWASAGGCCQRQSGSLTCAAGLLLLEQLHGQLALLLVKVQVCRGVRVGRHPLGMPGRRGGRRRRHHRLLCAWLRQLLRLWVSQNQNFLFVLGDVPHKRVYVRELSMQQFVAQKSEPVLHAMHVCRTHPHPVLSPILVSRGHERVVKVVPCLVSATMLPPSGTKCHPHIPIFSVVIR